MPSIGVANIFGALLTTLLTKVVVAATLVPVAFASLAHWSDRLTGKTRIWLFLVVGSVISCAFILLHDYGPLFSVLGPFGPESLGNHQFVYIARDAGAALMVVLAFRIATWPIALSIATGLACYLTDPFLLRANFICSVIIFTLVIIDASHWQTRHRALSIVVLIGIAPAAVLKDPAGLSTGIVWLAVAAGLVYAVSSADTSLPRAQSALARWAVPVTAAMAVSIVFCGASLKTMAFPYGDGEIGPATRDIWEAVRERTPSDALIFTDQAGPKPTLMEGWNTYALQGQRQVFVANWYQSPQLRADPRARAKKLTLNNEVLSGARAPSQVPTRRAYNRYAAVVSKERRMPERWRYLYANTRYALYEWLTSQVEATSPR